jgi:MYXO-CTERM domain-containing protein
MRKVLVLLVLVLCISLVPANAQAPNTDTQAPMDAHDDDRDGTDLGWLGLLGLGGLFGLKRREREEHGRERVATAASRS